MRFKRLVIPFGIVGLVSIGTLQSAVADAPAVALMNGGGKIDIVVDGKPVATYYYADKAITRPFFAHVRAPDGVQLTRNHPPLEGRDVTDHPLFHPGIWMAFGDISGADDWRLKARVRHAEFVEEPRGGPEKGSFAVRNEYLDPKVPEKSICSEIARFEILGTSAGYLLLWDSTFSSDQGCYFGDQEEMGLGIRVATPLRVSSKKPDNLPVGTGTIRDSRGRKNEKEIAGNAAEWCDYSGTIAGKHAGMTIFCHPNNFRPSWFHARDYGLLVANAFGRHAFGKGDPSKVAIKPGASLRLRYGVLLHSNPQGERPELDAAYQEYLRTTGK
jgi:hypothetical protein